MQDTQFHNAMRILENGDVRYVYEIASATLKKNRNDPEAHHLMGLVQLREGRKDDALKSLLTANSLKRNQPAILAWIGLLFKERGDFAQSIVAFEKAVANDPRNAVLMCHLGEVLMLSGDRRSAATSYDRAITIAPQDPAVLANSARFHIKSHNLGKARDLAERAAAIAPRSAAATIALSEIDMREGHHSLVVDRLRMIVHESGNKPQDSAKLWHIYADANDRIGNFDVAFDAYDHANAIQERLYAKHVAQEVSPLTPKNLDRLITYYRLNPPPDQPIDAILRKSPVFLIGFSRSGTTWLDQILSSHPDVIVLEEEDNFVECWRNHLTTTEGLKALESLNVQQANAYRQNYWRRVANILGDDAKGKLVADKAPLNTAIIGLIYILFPNAKFVFSVRDPRDAVLSAFQQHFAINTSTYQFLDLKRAATFYDQIMTLGSIYRRSLPIDLVEIRYEDMVADLSTALRPIIDHLGLVWNDNLLNYTKTARNKTIRTPSARQVILKPYATSIGKWRNYETQMRPVLPLLNKWAAHFGYEVD